ncbi:MAG: sodium:proton antiporter, partial [Bacteroidales bacterium]
PVALNEDSITGQAFMRLAEEVVRQTEARNAALPKTQRVEMKGAKH